MAREQFTIEPVLTLLAATPPRLLKMTASLPPERLRAAPGPGEWSANEVLAHIRSCADQWGGSIQAILAQEHPTLRAINPRTWIKRTNYLDLDFAPSLQAYTAQRTKLLAVLQPLTPAGWARSATVTGAGAVLERSVFFYAQWLARHERPHLKQIMRIAEGMRK